ncbi:MAG: CopD family protein [Parahaliea sp.]
MLWLKAFHIIFMVCWFAGLFYLPRILVNYAASKDITSRRLLADMARRLYRFVTPFMWLTIGFGLALTHFNFSYYSQAHWLWAKLACVTALIIYHVICGRYVKAVNEERDAHSHVFYRFFNEFPVFLLFAIVLLVVLKPF